MFDLLRTPYPVAMADPVMEIPPLNMTTLQVSSPLTIKTLMTNEVIFPLPKICTLIGSYS